MIINRGTWDYYVFFKVQGGRPLSKRIERAAFQNYCLARYDNKKHEVVPTCKQILDINFIMREYYNQFSVMFGSTCSSLLDNHYYLEDNMQFFLMNPFRIINESEKVSICPSIMYLLNNGYGAVKIRLPLNNIDAHLVSSIDFRKWYAKAEQCTHMFSVISTDKEYGYVSDIQILIYEMISECFPGILQTAERFPCFESFIIQESSDPDICAKKHNNEDLKKIYDLCYPNKSLEETAKEKMISHMKEDCIEIKGLSFLKCIPGRMVTYCSHMTKACKETCNDSIPETIQYTYDIAICLGIWQKCNELVYYEKSQKDIHKTIENKSEYLMNANTFAQLIDTPYHWLTEMYDFVQENFKSNFKDRAERLKAIEELALDKHHERTNLIVNAIAFIGSILFALPSIQSTGHLLRNYLWDTSIELSTRLTVDDIAFGIWILLLAVVLISLISSILRYRRFFKRSMK